VLKGEAGHEQSCSRSVGWLGVVNISGCVCECGVDYNDNMSWIIDVCGVGGRV